MLGSMRRSTGLMLATMMALGAATAPALTAHPRVVQASAKAATPGRRGLFNDAVLPTGSSSYGRKGAGITMAQQQRTSAKKRTVARNRRHHR